MRLQGHHILVTAGATRAYLDDIRYLTNTATGRLGCEVAARASAEGAQVTMICGQGSLEPNQIIRPLTLLKRIRIERVETVEDLSRRMSAVLRRGKTTAVVHSMGVQDYVPARRERGKVSTRRGAWMVKLKPAPKVIDGVKRWSPKTLLVGFKLLSGVSRRTLVREALRLKKRSGADAIVANDWKTVRHGVQASYLLTGHSVRSARGKVGTANMIVKYLGEKLNG